MKKYEDARQECGWEQKMENRSYWLEGSLQIGLPLLVYLAFQSIFQMAAGAVFGEKVLLEHSILIQALGNLLALALFDRLFWQREKSWREKSRREKSQREKKRSWGRALRLKEIFLILGAAVFLSRGLNHFIGLTPLPEWFPGYEASSIYESGESFYICALAVLIAAPLLEEFLMRGILYERLCMWTGNKRAAVLGSALLFGLFHGNVVQGIYAFCLGIFFAWLLECYQSLWAPVLAHGTANGISLMLETAEGEAAWEKLILAGRLMGIPAMVRELFLTAFFLLLGYFFIRQMKISMYKKEK